MKSRYKTILFAILNIILLIGVALIGIIVRYSEKSGWVENRSVINIFTISALFALLTIVLVEFVSPFIAKTATFTTFFAALGIFLMMTFSSDTLNFLPSIGIDLDGPVFYYFFRIANFLAFILTLGSLYLFFKQDYHIKTNTEIDIVAAVIMISSIVFYLVLVFFNYEQYAVIPAFIVALFFLISFTYNVITNGKINVTYVYTFFIATLVLGIEMAEVLNFRVSDYFQSAGIPAFASIAITALFFLIYMYYVLSINKKADKNEVNEQRIMELQSNVLKNQMDPHFVFNSLGIIKSSYVKDTELGNKAIDLFSKHLRAYVEAGDVTLVPLNIELENVSSYVDLVNIRGEKVFDVIYNIECTDFKIPYFSLQPFIENAIKYSRVNEKEDGYIEIHTFEEEDDYMIQIIDNGVGFDTTKIRNTSYGISNARERFRLINKASLSIDSKINEGTKITIRIPKR